MKPSYSRLVIAGLKGGSGKTTLSLGLIAAWREKGLRVVPFKKGPDYIDAGWLSSAAGHLCYNLDPFLIGRERILSSFKAHFGQADCAIIEGNRGIYDGMDAEGTYSTAELAKILSSSVILIVDCAKVTRTVAAMVFGMQKFDNKIDIKGVVLNQIAGARHEKIIREAVEKYCKMPVLGAIPKMRNDLLSERHMGLTPFQEHPDVEKAISYAAEVARKYLDLDAIWDIARKAKQLRGGSEVTSSEAADTDIRRLTRGGSPPVKVGIVKDSAFQFYYPENFEELEKKGAEIIEVSALKEKMLPDIDALYIGGGFPETNAIALAKNTAFRKSLRKAVEGGLPVYAECGGLMYLGSSLLLGNKKYPMAGVLPLVFSLEKKPQAHGYTIADVTSQNPFYPKGTVLKGHEFHYSRAVEIKGKEGIDFSFTMKRGQGIRDGRDGVCYKNVLATYTHLHAYGSPEWAEGLVKRAILYQKEKAKVVDKERNNKIAGRP